MVTIKLLLIVCPLLLAYPRATEANADDLNNWEGGEEENDIVTDAPIPVVLWHGMGDSCCRSSSMGYIKKTIEQQINGVYVASIMIGKNQEEDTVNGYFKDCNEQVQEACDIVKKDPQLKGGYNAVGFSQGGQFLRALVQRCPDPPMLNLVTFGAQHQGVYGFPRCPGENQTICNLVRKLLNYGAYTSFVQKNLVQAQYWHDPVAEDVYRAKSLFLADINNENTPRKQEYVNNILTLKNFVMIKFRDDTMVDPAESELFGYFKPGQAKEIELLNETGLYLEDRLGLKQLDAKGQLHRYTVPGDHLQIDINWFVSEIINKFLR